MLAHTRAMIAATAYAVLNGSKVAGLYDHSSRRHLRVAAEVQGEYLQGFDGDRSARFGGRLPEIYDAGNAAYVSVEVEGRMARGYDRNSSSAYTAEVGDRLVQVYDHGAGAWFAFDVNKR